MAASIQSRIFGHLPSGEVVNAFVLRGRAGLELEAINYGGIVTRLVAPDRHGNGGDVVLGFDKLESYLSGHPYFGAIAGRVAGRITRAQFVLDGKIYQLAANNPPNHLHGGWQGFDKRMWTASAKMREGDTPSLLLSYRSLDGEEGFPGNVDVRVTYSITPDNAFLIETEAMTDRPTPFSLTHHSYFNLAGEGCGTIEDHELQVNADVFIPSDGDMTLLPKRVEAAGTACDLNQHRRLGDVIPKLHNYHGDLYQLRRPVEKETAKLISAARLSDRSSGRILEVSSTESFLQIYTGAYLDGRLTGKSGKPYVRYAGICLECENYPDGANVPELGDNVLRPGQVLRQATSYSFTAL